MGVSRAGDGAVAAGLLGGFAAGAIVGSAVAARPYYYAPVYVAPPPYPPPPYAGPACYWTRGEPAWNGVTWVREPRRQVCD